MRSIIVSTLVLLILGGAAFAQGQGQPKVPNGFKAEEWQEYQGHSQELNKAFQYKEYDRGLELLPKMIALMDKAIGRVESGETKFEDDEKRDAHLNALKRAGWGQAGNWYNLACCQAMTGDKTAAIASLKTAVDIGWMDVDHMKVDTDLNPIREEAGYKAIIERLNYNDAFEVHVPEGLEGSAPMLVALHPLNGNETAFIEKFKGLADATKMILACPRGPITLATGKYGWKRHSDDEDSAIKKIVETIKTVRAKYAVDPKRVYLMGVGNGGFFSSLVVLKHPELVAGAIPINAFWNKYYFVEVENGEDTFAKAKTAGTKFCFIQGKDDAFFGKAEGAVKSLTEREIAAKMIEFEGGKKLPENITDLVKDALIWLAGE